MSTRGRRSLTDAAASRAAKPSDPAMERALAEASKHVSDDAKPKLRKATFTLPLDLVNELRLASAVIPPIDLNDTLARGSLSAIAERALRRELDELRSSYNEGAPFEKRGRRKPRARVGRPVGS